VASNGIVRLMQVSLRQFSTAE